MIIVFSVKNNIIFVNGLLLNLWKEMSLIKYGNNVIIRWFLGLFIQFLLPQD